MAPSGLKKALSFRAAELALRLEGTLGAEWSMHQLYRSCWNHRCRFRRGCHFLSKSWMCQFSRNVNQGADFQSSRAADESMWWVCRRSCFKTESSSGLSSSSLAFHLYRSWRSLSSRCFTRTGFHSALRRRGLRRGASKGGLRRGRGLRGEREGFKGVGFEKGKLRRGASKGRASKGGASAYLKMSSFTPY